MLEGTTKAYFDVEGGVFQHAALVLEMQTERGEGLFAKLVIM